ncbi:MAG: hypothetical protein IPJ37_00675 [Bacteroidales bacterium]|nr:hypothetical protein [Bacteroidales bacterium]
MRKRLLQAAGKYTGLGFKPSIFNKSGVPGARIELVSVKTFRNYDEASIFLKGFKAKYDPGAWIYSSR